MLRPHSDAYISLVIRLLLSIPICAPVVFFSRRIPTFAAPFQCGRLTTDCGLKFTHTYLFTTSLFIAVAACHVRHPHLLRQQVVHCGPQGDQSLGHHREPDYGECILTWYHS